MKAEVLRNQKKAERKAFKIVFSALQSLTPKVLKTKPYGLYLDVIPNSFTKDYYEKLYFELGVFTFQTSELKLKVSFRDAAWLLYLKEEVLNKLIGDRITNVQQNTIDTIRKILATATAESKSPNEIARQIKKELKGINIKRARTIARTESLLATSLAKQKQAQQSGIDSGLYKLWIHNKHGDFRENHLALNNTYVLANEPFNVSGKLMQFPGDPNGGAKEVINCKCNLSYVSKNVLVALDLWNG